MTRPLPPWVEGRTLYHLHALRAAGAPDANPDVHAGSPCGHGLRRLVGWLDHVAGLGAGAVLLTPIGVSMTHGYDVVDPFRLDQRLGDDRDFDDFVDACATRDLRIVLDGVFNHVGRAFPRFADVRRDGPRSAGASWFRIDPSRDDGDGFGYDTFEGHRDLVALDHHSEEVLEWAVAVATHWLARGADGWRLDAAYAVPAEFWHRFSGAVLERHPDALLFGEHIHGDYPGFVARSGLHAVTQYELHKALWSACNDRNLFELSWALHRHRDFCATFTPVTFVGNHDVTRIRSQLADPGHTGHVLAVLFTAPGIPCIYYGDELGARGVKEHRRGGDDAIRPTLDALPSTGRDPDLFDTHRRLIALRRARPWVTDARLEVTVTENHHLQYVVSSTQHGLLVAIDLGGGPTAHCVDLDRWVPIAGSDPSPADGTLLSGTWTILERR